ncbi:hypothetical protein [Cryptosporangium sp. NPDC048952]|uniref:hypothetical protein n=1 Tax=Cryptosporangium sp. NPDC048952 TaxID=3363961 RepID=UPI00371E7C2F
MGSKARRTALSVAGLALASGATMGMAAPASASTHAGDDYAAGGYEAEYGSDHESSSAVAGSYTKIEKTEVKWAAADKKKDYSAGKVKAGWVKDDHGHGSDCDDECDKNPGWHKDHDKGHEHGKSKWKRDQVKGFHHSYRACKAAGKRGVHKGWWDSYDCDFTKRGYKGWHQSWNKWGSNDWRCRGTWVLNIR